MHRLRSFLSALKPTRLGVLFAVLIGLGVGFWHWGRPPQPRMVLPCVGPGHVYFSPDGKTLAMTHGGPDECVLTLWDLASGQKKHDLFQSHWPGDVVFSPDGRTLVCSFEEPFDQRIHAWDVVSGRELGTYDKWVRSIHCLTFSAAGKLLGIDESGVLWDVAANKAVQNLIAKGEKPEFSSDHTIGVRKGSRVKIWDVATQTVRAEIQDVCIAPDTVKRSDRRWLVFLVPRSAIACDLQTGAQHQLDAAGLVRDGSLAPDGRTLALEVRNAVASSPSKSWWHHFMSWLGIAEDPSPEHVNLKTFPGAEDLATLQRCTTPVFSPDGSILAVRASNERSVQLWDFPIRKPIGKILGLAGLAAVATLLAFKGLGWRRRRRFLQASGVGVAVSSGQIASAD